MAEWSDAPLDSRAADGASPKLLFRSECTVIIMKMSISKLYPVALAFGFALLSNQVAAQSNTNTTIQEGQINTNDTYQRGDWNDNATYQEGRDNANRTRQRGQENWNETGQFGDVNYNETDQRGRWNRTQLRRGSSRD